MISKIFGSTEKSASYLTSASLFNSIVAIIGGFFAAKWLLPEELGDFNVLSIFTSYIVLVQIGMASGLSRELSFFYGQNNEKHAKALAATAKFFMLNLSLLILLFSIIIGAYFLFKTKYEYAIGSVVIGVTSFGGLYTTKYLKVLYRHGSHFNILAKITVIEALVNFLSLIFVYKYNFYGLCIRAILVSFISWYFAEKWKPLSVKSKWSLGNFKALNKVGIPIFFVANIYGLWPTFQRTMIVSLLGTRALGLYSLANIVQGILNTMSGAYSSVIFPKMVRSYGSGASFIELMKIPVKFVAVIFSGNIFLLIIGWFLLPIVVSYFLPNYIEGIEAAQWMLLVVVVNSLLIFSNIYMVVKKNHLRLISYSLGILVWFLVIRSNEIVNEGDLVVFSKALFYGFLTIALVDLFMYYLIYKKENKLKL